MPLLNQGPRWYPTSIAQLDAFLHKGMDNKGAIKNLPKLRRNICYSLQYNQYLNQTIDEIDLSNPLISQTYKSFLVCTASIVEGILYYCVYSNSYNTIEWIETSRLKTSDFNSEGQNLKLTTIVYRKIGKPQIKDGTTFNELFKKAQNKGLLGSNNHIYALIKNMNKKRNKIHLQDADNTGELDYNIFDDNLFHDSKKCLANVLQNTIFNFEPSDASLFPHLEDQFT